MKTLLIATDFSANARHVASYGYLLAEQMRANVVLCHALNVPSECLQTGAVAWPADIYDDLIKDGSVALNQLKKRLIKDNDSQDGHPRILCTQEAGFVTDVLNTAAEQYKADIILMGMHNTGAVNTFAMGNHTRTMIEAAVKPLLLVPAGYIFRLVRKVALSLDLDNNDIGSIEQVVSFAKLLNAEIVLTHIENKKNATGHQLTGAALAESVADKFNYQKITYKEVNNRNVGDGLSSLITEEHIDIVAMIHHEHGFLSELIQGSYTQKAARKLVAPLLVIKNNPGKISDDK